MFGGSPPGPTIRRAYTSSGPRGVSHVATYGLQFIKQIAADFALDGHRVPGKVFIAATGPDGKGRELLAADFFPRGGTNRVERIGLQVRTTQHLRDGKV